MDPKASSAIDSVDFNRYAYARNDPYRYVNPVRQFEAMAKYDAAQA
jgi:hypothetical protein